MSEAHFLFFLPRVTANKIIKYPYRRNNYRELEAFAETKRKAINSVHSSGYDNAAAAAGHTFYPAGFTEFAGWSTSSVQ